MPTTARWFCRKLMMQTFIFGGLRMAKTKLQLLDSGRSCVTYSLMADGSRLPWNRTSAVCSALADRCCDSWLECRIALTSSVMASLNRICAMTSFYHFRSKSVVIQSFVVVLSVQLYVIRSQDVV